jgi:DNA polymerase III gamma/tau subunit
LAGTLALAGVSSLFAQRSFTINGRVKVEGGSLDGVKVIVYKAGQKQRTLSNGLNKFSLDLEVNTTYQLEFVKDGFVTKKLDFDTNAPAEAAANGFTPFEFGVNLFKQYEGVNTVVFNQPVGMIRYDATADDFDYDTDYTKSIQSALAKTIAEVEQKQAEEQQRADAEAKLKEDEEKAKAKAEAAKAKQEAEATKEQARLQKEQEATAQKEKARVEAEAAKAQAAAQKAEAAAQKAEQERLAEESRKAKAPPEPKAKPEPKPKQELKPKPEPKPKPDTKPEPPPAPVAKVKPPKQKPEPNPTPIVAQIKGSRGSPKEGEDIRRGLAPKEQEEASRIQPAKVNEGAEARPEVVVPEVKVTRKQELIVEANQVITKVEVDNGKKRTEYRRVAHKRGSVVYFKDGETCTERVYETEALAETR